MVEAKVEYALEWQQGNGQDGVWSTVPGILQDCEVTRRNLRPSTSYSFRVRARLVSYNFFLRACFFNDSKHQIKIQANGQWSQFGDVTTIVTKDADVKTGIGMRVTEKGHVVSSANYIHVDCEVYLDPIFTGQSIRAWRACCKVWNDPNW